jgi:hypothetical protein
MSIRSLSHTIPTGPLIARLFNANGCQIVKLIEERNSDATKNIIAGTVGATIFFPALFFWIWEMKKRSKLSRYETATRF